MKRLLAGVALLLSLILLVACSPRKAAPGAIVDDLGREVNIEKIPQRILSLAPSNTEILFALGLGDKVVGVTSFDDYPEEAKAKTKVGAPFPGFNLEKIVELEPDVVFSISGSVVEQVAQLGLKVVVLQPQGIDDIFQDIILVGKISGEEDEAAELVRQMKERIGAVAAKTAGLTEKPRVFYGADVSVPTQLWTAGSGTFIDAILSLAGVRNIAGNLPGYFSFSLEQLVDADPDAIVLGGAQWGVTREEVASREGWRDLRAVQEGKLFVIDDDVLVRPGPRIVQGLEDTTKLLHPELSP